MADTRALIAALAAAGVPSLADALGGAFDPRLVAIIVTGIGLGLAGGLARALMPWGKSSWGWRDGVKAIALGIIVGGGTALALAHPRLDWLGDPGRMAVEGVAGYLASKVLDQLDAIGPRGIFDWLARRGTPQPSIVPKEQDKP